jgi:hypothetical protein
MMDGPKRSSWISVYVRRKQLIIARHKVGSSGKSVWPGQIPKLCSFSILVHISVFVRHRRERRDGFGIKCRRIVGEEPIAALRVTPEYGIGGVIVAHELVPVKNASESREELVN